MTTKMENSDEDSFIILGSTPGSSLDIKYNGITVNGNKSLEKLPEEPTINGDADFKANFQLGDIPTPTSMMIASNIVSVDRTMEELQTKFGELLDENLILKGALQQNNDSMKEQFMLIASCQEDMMRTHRLHKEKFDETRELIEKLRQENKKLKRDITKLGDNGGSLPTSTSLANGETAEASPPIRSPHSSIVYEFVTSPDDDTMNKLTSQLELVEKQRRQVIAENEKLTWQKESLEHIVDVMSKERDELKEKIKRIELQEFNKENEHSLELIKLKDTIQELQNNLSARNMIEEKDRKKESHVQQLEQRVASLQSELKVSQLKILDLENVKLEYMRLRSGSSETVKLYKDQVQDLQSRLKEAQTTVFQPVRFSISTEPDSTGSEYTSLISNVKLYDKTLKHMSELLNSLTHGTSDNIIKTMDVVAKVLEFKLEKGTIEKVRTGVMDIKQSLEQQHSAALNNIGQIRGTLSIFEAIFQDYKELLKKGLCKSDTVGTASGPANVEALTSALLARGSELQAAQQEVRRLTAEMNNMRGETVDIGLMKVQIDTYKADFEEERQSRQHMASEREAVLADLRATQRRNQELVEQLEEVRKLNAGVFVSATAKKPKTTPPHKVGSSSNAMATGNVTYKCPKCMRFSSPEYKVMEDHFDYCLDDF